MTRFLVTGASGLLGLNFSLQVAGQHEVVAVVNRHGLQGVPFPVVSADLTQPEAIERLLEDTQPDVVINCAAIAILDTCEAQPELAYRLNAVFPEELAAATKRLGIQMVHLSTDAVFDGVRGCYREDDPPSPINHYGRTKVAGEQGVLHANPDALVARVNFYGWSLRGKRSLAEWFYYQLAAGQPVKGFTDVFFCPLEVNDLIDILLEMAALRLNGLYHVVSSECLNKYEFGLRIARQFGFDDGLIVPISWKDSGLKADRSTNLQLNADKLAGMLGRLPPEQAPGLQRFRELQRAGYPERLLAMGANA